MNLTSTEAAERLRKDYGIRVGSKIYTTVLHVSRSGMSRTIQTTISHKGQVFDISHLVAAATGMRFDRDRGGVVAGGVGMDMAFHVVYSLSRALFPKGHKCTGKETCPSNDHSNDYGRATSRARDELTAEGVELHSGDPEEYRAAHRLIRERAAEIRERDSLTFRRGRHHTDGGYALQKVGL